MSVGQEGVAEDVGVDTFVAVAVGAMEDEEVGRPIAAQLNPPVLNVMLSHPVVFFNASLKML